MTEIGVIGAGVGGLHLALYLQRHGIGVTLYAERSPDDQRVMRLPNTAGHWSGTRARERELGVNHWDEAGEEWGIRDIRVFLQAGPEPLVIRAAGVRGIAVDQRMYTARLIEDFQQRGGTVVVGAVSREALEPLSEQHDLVVVSAGRGSMAELFPRRADASPFSKPQRFLCTAIYQGHELIEPTTLNLSVAPGSGELFEVPYLTFEGPRTCLFFEVVPGGLLDPLRHVRYDEAPQAFERTVLEVLEAAFPVTRDRIDDESFGVTAPHNVLQGSITPTARRGYAQLDNGRHVMALGDVQVVNDPIMGQGANTASRCAFLLGEAIVEDDLAFDELWCERAEARMWDHQRTAFTWNNHMLRVPLPENVVKLLVAASQDRRITDAGFLNLDMTERNWNMVATTERTDRLLRRLGHDPDALLPAPPAEGARA